MCTITKGNLKIITEAIISVTCAQEIFAQLGQGPSPAPQNHLTNHSFSSVYCLLTMYNNSMLEKFSPILKEFVV